MKPAASLFLPLAVLGLAGCDGHFRTLYVSPMGSAAPRGSFGSTVIRADGSEDVPTIIGRVAGELGMQADPKREMRWSVHTVGNNSFMLAAKKDPAGFWIITLGDWPTFGRSTQSKLAEEKITATLKKPNQSSATVFKKQG